MYGFKALLSFFFRKLIQGSQEQISHISYDSLLIGAFSLVDHQPMMPAIAT
jgi:hypothetical protein